MNTLMTFSEKERAYHSYQARQNYLRIQRSIDQEMDELRTAVQEERAALAEERAALAEARAANEQERAAKEQERAAKDAALREIERLKALLQDRSTEGD